MKFRKKPVVIEATQWHKMGDHPNVVVIPASIASTIDDRASHANTSLWAWIGTLEGGHLVMPGDWIITGVQGEQYPCKPDIFEATYEAAT